MKNVTAEDLLKLRILKGSRIITVKAWQNQKFYHNHEF